MRTLRTGELCNVSAVTQPGRSPGEHPGPPTLTGWLSVPGPHFFLLDTLSTWFQGPFKWSKGEDLTSRSSLLLRVLKIAWREGKWKPVVKKWDRHSRWISPVTDPEWSRFGRPHKHDPKHFGFWTTPFFVANTRPKTGGIRTSVSFVCVGSKLE